MRGESGGGGGGALKYFVAGRRVGGGVREGSPSKQAGEKGVEGRA